MSQSNSLQKVVIDLRNSEIRMKQSDHIRFGMFFISVFIFATWILIDGKFLYFGLLTLVLILAVPLYYCIRVTDARKSWYWEGVRHEVKGQNLREMWDTCENGEWLLWFVAHMIGKPGWPSHQQVVLASCQCARLALRHVEDGENRPLKAIEAAESWAHGHVSVDQVRVAGDAAGRSQHGNTAYCAARAAEGAAWAVYAHEDGDSFRLAQAASQAASAAKSASGYNILDLHGYSHKAEATKAEKNTLRECANIARRMLNVPDKITNELPIYGWIKRWNRNLKNQRTGRMDWIPIAVSRNSPKVLLDGSEINGDKVNPALRIFSVIMATASVLALIVALGRNPLEYYTWLRWLICSTSVIMIYRGDVQGSSKLAYILAPIAILFNPIFPVHIHAKSADVLRIWHIIDLVAAMLLGLLTIFMEIQFYRLMKYGEALRLEVNRS